MHTDRWQHAAVPATAGAVPVDPSALVAVGRPRVGDPTPIDDETTALAIPVGATAAFAADPIATRRPAADASRAARAPGGAATWVGRAVVLAALLVVIVIALTGLLGSASPAGPGPSPGASSASSPRVSPPSASPSIEPSARPSPSAVAPSPTPDPAISSLAAMDDAISAARGGPDGLKGKDANDLEQRTAAIRRALDVGDRHAALDLARKLDHRVADVAEHLGEDQASRLRTASRDLVRALGG